MRQTRDGKSAGRDTSSSSARSLRSQRTGRAALRATIVIASENGALPLQHKAEAMLSDMLARGDELT